MKNDVALRIEGALLERLLEQAVRGGARLGGVRRCGKRTITVSTDVRGASILEALCKKYGLNCKTLRRSERALLPRRMRKRWTLLLSVAVFLTICGFVLSRVWLVEIEFTGSCASLGDSKRLMEHIWNAGYHTGMTIDDASIDRMQKQLLAENDDLSFVGVRRQGIRLLVEASPEVAAPELHALNNARDLVAGRDGVVESVTVRSGRACVLPGDTVRMGQLLIRGEEMKNKEETVAVRAEGEVVARCWYEGGATGETKTVQSCRSGRSESESRLRLREYAFQMRSCDEFASEEIETEILPVVGLFLPIEIERRTHYETHSVWETRDSKRLQDALTLLSRADALQKLASDGVSWREIEEWTDVDQNGNQMQVRVVLEIHTDIAVGRGALVEEVN